MHFFLDTSTGALTYQFEEENVQHEAIFVVFVWGSFFFCWVGQLWHQFGNFFHQHQKLKDEKFIHEFKKHILKWPFFTRIFFLFCVFLLTNLVVLKPSIKQQSFREKVAAFGIYISEANSLVQIWSTSLVQVFNFKLQKTMGPPSPRKGSPLIDLWFQTPRLRQVSGQSLAPGMYETWLDRIIGDKLQAGTAGGWSNHPTDSGVTTGYLSWCVGRF